MWFKVDDLLAFNVKVMQAGNKAMGLWVRAGSWSAQQLTDGFVPLGMIAALGGAPADARALVAAGLWENAPAGYQFHDWDEYQPDAASARQQRSERPGTYSERAKKANHTRWHKDRGIRVPECELCYPKGPGRDYTEGFPSDDP